MKITSIRLFWDTLPMYNIVFFRKYTVVLSSASVAIGCRRPRAFLLEFSWSIPWPLAEVHPTSLEVIFQFLSKFYFVLTCVDGLNEILPCQIFLSLAFFIYFWVKFDTHYSWKTYTLGYFWVLIGSFPGTVPGKKFCHEIMFKSE